MPRRYIQAGGNPFQVDLGPSVFNPNPPDDLIERQGEPCVWLRAMPRPEARDNQKMTHYADGDTTMYRVDRFRRMPLESIQNQEIEELDLFTRYGPIAKVHKLWINQNEDYGGNVDLEVVETDENRIRIAPNPEFNPDYDIKCDYEVEAFQRKLYKPLFLAENGRNLFLPDSRELIVKVHEVWQKIPGSDSFERLEGVKSDLTKLILPQVAEKGREFIIDVTTYSPVSIGYKTIDLKDERLSEKSGLKLIAGDLDLVVPTNINLAPDDLLIPLNSLTTEKEWVRRDRDGRFPLKFSPVREIYAVYSNTEEFFKFRVEDGRYLVMEDICPDQLMIIYGFNPRFRVLPETTLSAIARQRQPRKFNARLDQTNLDLGRILEEVLK